ncbi:4-hydroxybenzoyl-CoA thioesterase [Lampropedia cohaerens]|uniref:4-hydroxybenzoyl-CoA thioesterase n=1 Tax=Lampropedia cohaerens TaxID=1610491 RepID=A0A0U1PWZ0_9BURK|nr:YbgC/FadM family acyl-CoA thioesterase [Lampropedia cohaerens]KKW67000.1 4-hydroxybenzoyl-CoA thioesterase [Lampropedia cohaerens]
MTARSDFRFFSHHQVRWAEVDMQQVVFNGHYLQWIDDAMTDYWRALAVPYAQSMALLRGEWYVRKAELLYHAPATLDDWLAIGLAMRRIGNSSLHIDVGIFRGEKLLTQAQMVYVFADPSTHTARPVPEALRQALADFEAGESVVQVRTGSWQSLGDAAAAVRKAVFVDEQGFALEEEWDGLDAQALHCVLFNCLQMPVAVGRMLVHAPGIARVGRMCVVKALRGMAYGAQVLAALEQAARTRGDRQIVLHAQLAAQSFYRRQGYQPHGEVFDEAGAPHIEMVKSLQD